MARAKKVCDYNSTLAVRLRELINEKKTTITNVAEVADVTRQAVSAYQDGSSQPTADTLKKIAKHFNVSVDWLLGLSETKSTDPKVKEICEYTGLSEEAIEKLHEHTEFNKNYPQYTNVLEHLDIFIENCGYIFEYLNKYIESVSLCGALEKEYPNIDFTVGDRGLVVNTNAREVRQKTFSEYEKEAIKDYQEEIEEKQPLYLYNLQKMFIEFVEKYGEEKKKCVTMKELVENYEMYSNSKKLYLSNLDTSFENLNEYITSIADKFHIKEIANTLNENKDGANNG